MVCLINASLSHFTFGLDMMCGETQRLDTKLSKCTSWKRKQDQEFSLSPFLGTISMETFRECGSLNEMVT